MPEGRNRFPVTPYRLLILCILLALGISQVVPALKGEDAAPNTLDFILGVIIVILMFFASYLESAAPEDGIGGWFFHKDYTEQLMTWFIWPVVLYLFTFVGSVLGSVISYLLIVFFPRSDYTFKIHWSETVYSLLPSNAYAAAL
ncbi:uncharacterized protein STEHIDRAFT_123110, partial [Stereum hirsutum FP-91666 SS1]|uniref:uncharacterized protein n=1 Tax=Stereum hirsutum (strain FP-91666) TaxID=721885 RepID=UPI000444A74F